MSENPPVPLEGERKELSDVLTQFKHTEDGKTKFSLWNHSRDKDFTFTYTINNKSNGRALSDNTTCPQDGTFVCTLHPGEATEVFEAWQFGGWSSKWSWKSPPDREWLDSQADKLFAVAEEAMAAVRAVVAEATGITDPHEQATQLSASQIADICESYAVPFVDLTFPPQAQPTLYRDFEVDSGPSLHSTDVVRRKLPFLRPVHYLEDPKKTPPSLFVGKIEPSDQVQGALGSCYLNCSIASMAEHPKRIRALFNFFPGGHRNPSLGIYRVRTCFTGWFETMTLDDFLPTSNNAPIFAKNKSEPQEFWVAGLEKVYAKRFGSYKSVCSGSAGQATADLLGTPYLALSELECFENDKDGELWDILLEADRNKHLVNLSCPGKNEGASDEVYKSVGLAKQHAYSALRFETFHGEKLVQIKNPWAGSTEWKGKWSDGDEESWTDEAKAALGFTTEPDGCFWMSWRDCWKYFSGGYLNYCLDNYSCVRVKNAWVDGAPKFCFKITSNSSNSKLYACICQRASRGLPEGHPDRKYQGLRMAITRQTNSAPPSETIAMSHPKLFMCNRDQFATAELEQSTSDRPYFCLPLCFEENCNKDFTMVLFVSDPNAAVEVVAFGDQGHHVNRPHTFDPLKSARISGSSVPAQIQTPKMNGQYIEVDLAASGGVVKFKAATKSFKENSTAAAAAESQPDVSDVNVMMAALERVKTIAAGNGVPARGAEINTAASATATADSMQSDEDVDDDNEPPAPPQPTYNNKPSAPAPAQAQGPGSSFVAGQRVRCRWKGRSKLYRGTIVSDNGDGTFDVEYDDGDFEAAAPVQNIQSLQPATNDADRLELLAAQQTFYEGQLVQAKWKGRDKWYTAVVWEVHDDDQPVATYKLRYDDAQEEDRVKPQNMRMGSAAQLAAECKAFEVGMPVEGRWKGRSQWFPATVTADDGMFGSYSLSYDDGDEEEHVRAHNIRLPGEDASMFADDEESYAMLENMFSTFDHSEPFGYLDKSEAMAAFMAFFPEASVSELHERITAADTNSDGMLDLDEFIAIARSVLSHS